MKNLKTYFICLLIIAGNKINAQNVFPSTGNVGIGTTTPVALLHVNGEVRISDRRLVGTGGLAFGQDALISNTTGVSNFAIGDLALTNNLSGSYNTVLGHESLIGNTIGNRNTAVGFISLRGNQGGSDNTAMGFSALYNSGIGNKNTSIGANSLYTCIKGNYNTAMGFNSLYYNTKGNNNTSLGALALENNTIGSNNTALGYDAEVSSGNLHNATAIGNSALVDASNKVRIGNASVTSNGGQVSWTAYSDARIKNNIQDNVPGLEFINRLKPITYHFDVDKQNTLSGLKNSEQIEGMYDIEKIQFTGFIAQEVDAAAQQINYDFSGVDKSGEIMGLRYAEFVVPLVKAVQELDTKNEELRMENEELKMQNKELQKQISESKIIENDFEKRIVKLEKKQAKSNTNNQEETAVQQIRLSADNTVASLSQNIPNPFSGKTEIHYFVPESAASAFIKIAKANGASLFTADIKLGNGILEIDASQLAAGTYSYTLIVDGKVIDTKLMVMQQ